MRLPPILAGERRPLLARLVANGAGQAVAAVLTALLVRAIFDGPLLHRGQTSAAGLAGLITGLLAVAGLNAWLRYRERVDAERLGQSYTTEVRVRLFRRLSSLAPRALHQRSRGGVLLRFIGDLTALRQWVSLGLARLLVAGVTASLALIALAMVAPLLAAGVGVVIGLGALAALRLGRSMQDAVEEARRRRAYLAANITEKVGSMAVVQAFDQTRRERRRVSGQSHRLRHAMVARAAVTGRLRAITEGTTAVATAAVLLAGVVEVAMGGATPGTVVAAMTIIGLLVPPLRDLGRVHEHWHGAEVSRRKIRGFMRGSEALRDVPGAPPLLTGLGLLRFEDVSVEGSIEGLSASARPGTVVALVGPNGSGKSTLLALATRLLDPARGRILLDGQDLAGHTLASVRRNVGMVSPDLPLLRGTIDKNLRYRWPDAPAEEIRRVSRLCGVDDIVGELPAGTSTRLAEGGLNLSLGQRQRIALARALVGRPRFLLLDEADANLDPRSAEILDRVLADFHGTVLMVTHHRDRLAAADAIWHLEDGRLVETGRPEALLGRRGPTSRLFERPEWAVS